MRVFPPKEWFRLLRKRCGVRWLSGAIGLSLVLGGIAAEGQVQPLAAPTIKIVVLEGEGSENDIQGGWVVAPVIRVEGAGGPIEGALVVFTTPDSGPSALFADGTHSLLVQTDSRGEAAARGLHANAVVGPFQVRVEASFRGARASSLVHQTNVQPISRVMAPAGRKPRSHMGLFIAIAGGAAAAIGIGFAGGRSGGGSTGSTSPQPTIITAGTVTVGPPR
jgi:hypothetical protein